MSKVSDAKARQGYAKSGRPCVGCRYIHQARNPESMAVINRCKIGGFAVKARATCDKWAENGSLLAAMEGGDNA